VTIFPRSERTQIPLTVEGCGLNWSFAFCTPNLLLTPPTAKISPATMMRACRRLSCTPRFPPKASQLSCETGLLGFVNHYRWIVVILIVTLIVIISIARTPRSFICPAELLLELPPLELSPELRSLEPLLAAGSGQLIVRVNAIGTNSACVFTSSGSKMSV